MVNTLNELQQTEQTVKHLLKNKNVRESLKKFDSATAIRYLSEIYKGNGWIVSYHAPSGHPSALLLSYPKNPQQTVLIVRIDCSTHELTFDDCRDHLLCFENELSTLYSCSQFCLIALNSFEQRSEKLESFNLLLQDWSYVEELIENYSRDNISEPRIQLFAHNKQTYRKVKRLMSQSNSIAVVQATGTGKSYLISKLLQDFRGEKRLVMAPSHYIINQLKEHIRWDSEQIEFMTYAKSIYLSESEVAALQPKMIVLDEFHRCGAEEWGKGVENILNAYPSAFKFGTSATPVRYMDNARDMSKELFNGNIAENLNLSQAIVRNILPMPKYVCALYTLGEEMNNMKSVIDASGQIVERKKQLNAELDAFSIDWERSRGIPHVLKKHLQKNMQKFIVFCKDEAHLLEMEPVVKRWFKEATGNFPVKSYRVYDNEPKSDEHLEAFKSNTSKDFVHLLFSINMLNEGLHVNDVHGVILLRPTESPNIFYQQIGRCLKAGLNHQPVIFDFVNNFKSIRLHEFIYDLEFARASYLEQRKEERLEDRCPKFTVNDEVREITEVFGEIKFQLDSWNVMYERLTDFYKKNHHTRPARESCSDQKLITWTSAQRMRYKKGFITDEQVSLLCAIDFQWDVYEAQWETNFEKLLVFKNKHGHCFVSQKREEFRKLSYWVSDMRQDYKNGKMSPDRIKRFEEIGFSWKAIDDKWMTRYMELKLFLKDNGWEKIIENKRVWQWTHTQRIHLRRKSMPDNKKMLMDELGIDWNPSSNMWAKKFDELIKYKQEYGNTNIPENSVKFHTLRVWLGNQRSNYKKNLLSDNQVKKLREAGVEFDFRKIVTENWNRYYNLAVQFYKKHGHVIVPVKQHKRLANWLDGNRLSAKKRLLTAEQLQKLNEIGFNWDSLEEKQNGRWMRNYNELIAYKNTNGHCNVPQGNEIYYTLAHWCSSQRMDFKKGKLNSSRIELLESIGFVWEVEWQTWLANFEQLKNHFELNGANSVIQNPNISVWLKYQKRRYDNGRLSEKEITLLNSIRLGWEIKSKEQLLQEKWMVSYEKLKEYREKHGTCNVPAHKKEIQTLASWVLTQRSSYHKNILSSERKKLLDKLSFEWNSIDVLRNEVWVVQFEKLNAYKAENGTCNVAKSNKTNRSLGLWVQRQRHQNRKGLLNKERMELLNSINFQWEFR